MATKKKDNNLAAGLMADLAMMAEDTEPVERSKPVRTKVQTKTQKQATTKAKSKPKQTQELKQVSEPPKRGRGRPKVGKRSDPDYVQVTAYIREDTHKSVKKQLIDESQDFGELIQDLLEGWLRKK